MTHRDLMNNIRLDRTITILIEKLAKPVNEIIRMILASGTYKDLMDEDTHLYNKSAECLAYLFDAEFKGDNETIEAFWESE